MGAKVPIMSRSTLVSKLPPALLAFASSPSMKHSCWRTGVPPRMAACLLMLQMASILCSPVALASPAPVSLPELMNVPRWFFMHKEQLPYAYAVPGPLCLLMIATSTRMSITPLTRSATPDMVFVEAAIVTPTWPPNDCDLTLTVARILVESVKLA